MTRIPALIFSARFNGHRDVVIIVRPGVAAKIENLARSPGYRTSGPKTGPGLCLSARIDVPKRFNSLVGLGDKADACSLVKAGA